MTLVQDSPVIGLSWFACTACGAYKLLLLAVFNRGGNAPCSGARQLRRPEIRSTPSLQRSKNVEVGSVALLPEMYMRVFNMLSFSSPLLLSLFVNSQETTRRGAQRLNKPYQPAPSRVEREFDWLRLPRRGDLPVSYAPS
jgi:hypothetical protein